MSFCGFEILPLTPEDDDTFDDYNNNINSNDNNNNNDNNTMLDDSQCHWIDDSECQENLFQIVPLMPEETIIDKDNHIHTHFKLFFEELGYLTEEPEPIDPTRDYDAEAKQMLEERDKTRQKHVHVSRIPSLSYSGVSSTSSSFHHQEHDVRSPLYMGHTGVIDHHPSTPHYQPYQHHHHPHHTPYHHHNHHHNHSITPKSHSQQSSSSSSSPSTQDPSNSSSSRT